MSETQERPGTHITVEVLTPAEVKRLEGRIDDLHNEIARLEKRIEGLHDTIFRYFERVSQLKNR